MKHIVEIWTANKDNYRIIGIATRITITEEDIEQLALQMFKDAHSVKDNVDYSARIDKTII